MISLLALEMPLSELQERQKLRLAYSARPLQASAELRPRESEEWHQSPRTSPRLDRHLEACLVRHLALLRMACLVLPFPLPQQVLLVFS